MLLLGLNALFAVISAFCAGLCVTLYCRGGGLSFKKASRPDERKRPAGRQADERRRRMEELENYFLYYGTILPPVGSAGPKHEKTEKEESDRRRVWRNSRYGKEEEA